MSDIAFIGLAMFYSGWFGLAIGHSRGSKAARKELAGAIEFERSCIEMSQKLKRTRHYTGDGLAITTNTIWKVRDLGEFAVTIREVAPKQEQDT